MSHCHFPYVLVLMFQYPWDIVKEAFSLGLINGGIPTRFGGLGLSVLDECIMAEEMAFGCTGIFTAMAAANGLAISSTRQS